MELYELDRLVKEWLACIKANILKASEKQLSYTTKKNDRDLVTMMDQTIEQYVRERILLTFPDACIIGEEDAMRNDLTSDQVWLIDPIDGTANFVKQKEDYCIMIAYFEKQRPMLSYIYDIKQDKLTWAMRGQGVFINDTKLEKPKNIALKDALISTDIRKIADRTLFQVLNEACFDFRYVGCSGLDAVKVVTGCYGGYLIPLAGGPWDFAPFLLMAQELDLHLSTWDGKALQIDQTSSFLLSTKQVYEDIKAYL